MDTETKSPPAANVAEAMAAKVEELRQIIAAQPDAADAHRMLGELLLRLERNGEALPVLHRAAQLVPQDTGVLNNLGIALHKSGNFAEAEVLFKRLLELVPQHHHARINFGNLLRDQRRFEQAENEYRQAVACRPDCAEAHSNLGNVLADRRRFVEAADCYAQAVRLEPAQPEHQLRLGRALFEHGDTAQARLNFESVAAQRPQSAAPLFEAAFCLPPVIPDAQSIPALRSRLRQDLEKIRSSGALLRDPFQEIANINFYLAYHGEDDVELQKLTAETFLAVCPALAYTAPHCKAHDAGVQPTGRKMRVGIVSKHLCRHTIGQLWRGLIAELARVGLEMELFEVVENNDAYSRFLKSCVRAHAVLPHTLPEAQALIAGRKLDVLIYPDIGMEPRSYFLAFARLAPVQCVLWGHPLTTGIPNVDYFLSTQDLEAEGAQSRYSEKLVTLKFLSNYYYRPSVPEPARSTFGLDSAENVYLCPQTLFKFHPEFDAALREILERDARGRLVLIEAGQPPLTTQLKDRFAVTLGAAAGRVTFVSRVDSSAYLGLLRCADVVLDPFHFGGGNTSYQALAAGTPVVTLPSKYLRGRITYALYQALGMKDCIAADRAAYVALACRIASDKALQKGLRARILEKNAVLFENQHVAREFRGCLEKLLYGRELDPPAETADAAAAAAAVAHPAVPCEPVIEAGEAGPRKVLIVNLGTTSQVVLMTAAVRDLHLAFPGHFVTDVYTSVPEVWEHNPHITRLPWRVAPLSGPRELLAENEVAIPGHELKIVKEAPDLEVIATEQAGDFASSLSYSNQNAYHAVHSYAHDLGRKLGVDFEVTTLRGDITISAQEQSWISQVQELGIPHGYWIVVTHGSGDLPVKHWPLEWYQEVVDAFRGKITFVQVGRAADGHRRLRHVVDLVGKTDLRQLIRLVYNSCGVVGPSSLLMHLAAAAPMPPFDNRRQRLPCLRPCVVIAGGREPWQWYSYSTHQILNTNGMLPCCAQGGCWRKKVKALAEGEIPEDDTCVAPVKAGHAVYIAKCLHMITPAMVINRIKVPYIGGILRYNDAPAVEPESKVEHAGAGAG